MTRGHYRPKPILLPQLMSLEQKDTPTSNQTSPEETTFGRISCLEYSGTES
jgi:hypothetical protein